MQEFSVAELSKILSAVFKNAFPDMIAVTGEVSGLTRQNSGHIYFSLKENDVTLSATYFKFYQTAGSFIPKNGDKVKVIGELKTYDKYSQYQINVRKITYDSEGLLWKQFEETKKKLEAEGLFREERKREIPKYPYRVAVLTSTSGAVIKDFIVTTNNEKGRYLIEVWNIPVQNVENAPIIAKTIEKAGKLSDRYDVMVVMRGGGSMEDLSVFNQEVIARAVAASQVPVISAVGHETDYTIIDFVSDKRAATPTAAAIMLSSYYKAAVTDIEKYYNSINRHMENVMQKYAQHIDYMNIKLENKSPVLKINKLNHLISQYEKILDNKMTKRIYSIKEYFLKLENKVKNNNPENKLENYKLRINNSSRNLYSAVLSRVTKLTNHINEKSSRIKINNPLKLIERYNHKIDNLSASLINITTNKESKYSIMLDKHTNSLEQFIANYLFNKYADLSRLESKLSVLDPKNVMERGYALVTQDEKVVSSIDDVHLNASLKIHLKDGKVFALPEKILKDNNNMEATEQEKIVK